MTKRFELYKCSICGNVVSVVECGGGVLVCCGKDMDLLETKTAKEEGKEKHVPVVEIKDGKVKVTVGSIPHPMEEKHYIELIQVIKGDNVIAEKHLFPGEKPEAEFCLADTKGITVRELCNIHGLWKN